MIGKLTGTVDSVGEDWVILDVHGVGYHVNASGRTLAALQAERGTVALHVDTRMREEQITLFGFRDAGERDWFRLLTQVQGVGGRVALSILTVFGPAELGTVIASEDRKGLTRAEGVGPKLAARIVNELRDRVPTLFPAPAAAARSDKAPPAGGGPAQDAVSALVNLGYGRSEAFAAVARVLQEQGETAGFDALVRAGLKELSA